MDVFCKYCSTTKPREDMRSVYNTKGQRTGVRCSHCDERIKRGSKMSAAQREAWSAPISKARREAQLRKLLEARKTP